jgi:GDPmannose 4,6-dehydratase
MKKALICGISGQDGAYLAQLLLKKGYEVVGTSRDAMTNSFINLKKLNIFKNIKIVSMAINDFRNVLYTIKIIAPDEIYNLSGQSSVSLSFEQPAETMASIATGTLNLLESIRFSGKLIRFYNAGSSECFGNTEHFSAHEDTSFCPESPYAVAKSTAYWLVHNYRKAYDIFACTGLLFNHESPLRPSRFVTQKIVQTAYKISQGSTENLKIGNISIQRDWGWAPDYVDAMWKMLQLHSPKDYVIATGRTVSLEYFIDKTFQFFGLNWKDYTKIDTNLFRPTDIQISKANPHSAHTELNWHHSVDIDGVILNMCQAVCRGKNYFSDD